MATITPPPPPPAVLEEVMSVTTTTNHTLETTTSPPPPTPTRTNHRQGVKKPQAKKSKDPLQHLLMPNIKNRKAVPNPEKTKFSKTKITKRWIETEKQMNGTFQITKCVKYQEPTKTTNSRKKLSNNQKIIQKQKQKFKNYFKHVPNPDQVRHENLPSPHTARPITEQNHTSTSGVHAAESRKVPNR